MAREIPEINASSARAASAPGAAARDSCHLPMQTLIRPVQVVRDLPTLQLDVPSRATYGCVGVGVGARKEKTHTHTHTHRARTHIAPTPTGTHTHTTARAHMPHPHPHPREWVLLAPHAGFILGVRRPGALRDVPAATRGDEATIRNPLAPTHPSCQTSVFGTCGGLCTGPGSVTLGSPDIYGYQRTVRIGGMLAVAKFRACSAGYAKLRLV